MTKVTQLPRIVLFACSFPALAMAAGVAELDVNGDSILSIDEVQTIYPEVTVEQFSAMDLNGDGALDDEEVSAAQEAGMMPSG